MKYELINKKDKKKKWTIVTDMDKKELKKIILNEFKLKEINEK
jgi:hypothetical protein